MARGQKFKAEEIIGKPLEAEIRWVPRNRRRGRENEK